MKLNEYQELAMRTAEYPVVPVPACGPLPIYPALGLAGESGEFADKVKKAWRNGTPLDLFSTVRELGDVLWYIAAAARDIGVTLEEVAEANIAKLTDRRDRGVIKSEGDDR